MTARDGDAERSPKALERLCRVYWPPLYAYIRREGYGIEDAQDLTQEFFARLLGKDWLQHLHDRRGKFRSFLLTFLKHFLCDQRDRAHALKRGGGRSFISLDAFAEEERQLIEPIEHLTPDRVFDRCWLRRLNEQAVDRLRAEFAAAGKAAQFEAFKHVQRGDRTGESHVRLARQLGMSPSAVKSALHRFHRRLGELLRDEVARTVGSPDAVNEELSLLLGRDGS
jgi:RNA polymerase sigma-70 factor (ECF subfamily)